MKLNVKTGKAWINGYFYFNTGNLAVELDTADGQLNRIDRVVVRWDLTNRVMSVKVKSSSFSASPTAPALQRDADVYELALADIYVGAGVTAITQSKITDQRLNTSLCGVVAAVVQQIDTAAFNAQLQAWFAEYQSDVYKRQGIHVSSTRLFKNGLHRHSSTLENGIEGGGVLRDHDRCGNIRTGHGLSLIHI